MKELLKTGIFGRCEDVNFVVVGNTLVYQNGEFDQIEHLNDDLTFIATAREISELYDCKCFNGMHDANLIWKRETVMTIAEIEKKLGIKNLKIIKEK